MNSQLPSLPPNNQLSTSNSSSILSPELALLAIFVLLSVLNMFYITKKISDNTTNIERLNTLLANEKNSQVLLPTSLNINGTTFLVRKADSTEMKWLIKDNADGFTDCPTKQIIYSNNPNDLRNIIWHEIYHAAVCDKPEGAHYWDNPNTETHVGIYRMADFHENFIRANPEFVKWATQ